MTLLKRLIPLVLAVVLSACIELPEVADPEAPPDAGVPDGGVPADTTPPSITAASPAHGSTNVATNPQFVFTFSEPMNVGTVQVSIAPTVALGALAWTNGNTALTVQPTAPLAQNTTYTLAVDGKDVAGNALTDRKLFSFSTTGPVPDTTPPTVLGFTPADSAIGIARNASITVTFSEPMDKASTQTAFEITSPPGFDSGVFDWNAEGTEMTFNPHTDFPYGTTVDWRLTTAAEDAAGNAIGAAAEASFRAIRVNTVTIDFDRLTSGAAGAPDYPRFGAFYNFEAVGDSTQNLQSRLLVGFKLDTLPDNLTRITASNLKWFVTGRTGAPFGTLGRLLLERVYIGETIAFSLNTEPPNPASKAQYESPALSAPIAIQSGEVTTTATFDVTSFVALDWAERTNRNTKRSQFRLRFETPSNNDGLNDNVHSDVEQTPKLAELEVTYEHP